MSVGRRRALRYVRNVADRDFQRAHEEGVKLKCDKPGAWRYYVGFKPSHRPSPEGAERLCAGCPLLQPCRVFAHNLEGADGVWGGQVWIDGVLQAD